MMRPWTKILSIPLSVLFWGLFLFVPVVQATDSSDNGVVLLETFEEDQPLAFPSHWQIRGDVQEAKLIYRVWKDGKNHFLRARAMKQDVQIGLSHSFDPVEYPYLRWRWRVAQLPAGADERLLEKNDSAAAVYVVFNGFLPYSIKYVWSTSLPVGTHLDSPVYSKAKVVVLRNGLLTRPRWQRETVDVYHDYVRLFGAEPGKARGIAILTDADDTGSLAQADYDDFVLLASRPFATDGTRAPSP